MSVVELVGVSFWYPDADYPALDGVDLELPEGVFALVTGPTGAGKSTLLRAMNGLVPHFTGGRWDGEARIAGRSTRAHAPRALSDVAAFVPQDPASSFVLDRVEDELAYAMENLAVPVATMRRRVEEVVDMFDIAGLRDRSVRTLSGGERQRVAIAAALTAGARVLLLDEPTSQLDPQGAEDVLAALQRLVHDNGMTVVCCEHRLERVAGFADIGVGCLPGGRVTAGDPATVFELCGTEPPVARLGRALGWKPLPLTVRDARRRASGLELARPAPRRFTRGGSVLHVRKLVAGYGGPPVLDGIDFAVNAGEIVAVMGRNGTGKTTLLHCLAGIHAPASGDVSVCGRAPRPGREAALCPQQPEVLLFTERVVDEVRATPGAADPHSVLSAVGIADLSQRHPRDVSAGQQLLTSVAAVVATGAPLLMLDESTRGLDAATKVRLADFLRRYVAGGRAVVLATHDVELVAEVATRVVLLGRGVIVADGDPVEVIGDSPVFSPQTARVLGPPWLTVGEVEAAVAG